MHKVLLLCWCFFGTTTSHSSLSAIKNLIGEPDYRKVKLYWETDKVNKPQNGFSVRYCELQSWGSQRCRTQQVDNPQTNNINVGEEIKVYSTDVNGLRMATTYSFEVKPKKEQGIREDRSDGDDKNENIIVIPTKGFSARATQCLPHASEIEVSTGPFFGGRIAVEATDGERCALDGEPSSPRDTYTLRINHAECGSQVNDTTVATFVLVQENLPILTHSTRRFLVLCTYQPETLTVRAGINLPTNHHRGQGLANIAAEDGSMRQARNGRTARLLQKPEALIHQEEYRVIKESDETNLLPLALIAVLMVAVIAGFIAIVIKWNLKRIDSDLDNVSIGSDLSTSSCSTVADADNANEQLSPANTRH